ncbi:MAG: ABC transporter permease subunit [Candidatus Adiutrix sp.]|jgi:peptide/nickel transport system permease protein|nr:ABC transporter permease subunit [Candidatus Adiutrix sp.]
MPWSIRKSGIDGRKAWPVPGSALWLLLRNPSAVAGGGIVLFMALMAVLAPWLAPYDPNALNLAARLQAPSLAHWFGTDEMGRDLLSRVVFGARVSLVIGLVVIILAGGLGTLAGASAGYLGGRFDNVVMRVMDVILSFPSLVLAMALAAALGPSLKNAILAVAFTQVPKFARLARGEALNIRERLFIKAARVSGFSAPWIITRHVIPNCLATIMVLATLTVGETILVAASLSFIGLGAQPPTPEWGAIISVGRKFLLDQWWYPTFPGLFIVLTVVGYNILGDALRDVFDPRLRGGRL